MFSEKTLLSLCQFLELQGREFVEVLLLKHGLRAELGAGLLSGVKHSLYSVPIEEYDKLRSLIEELFRTDNSLRGRAIAGDWSGEVQYNERYKDLVHCFAEDGFAIENQQLVKIKPEDEGVATARDSPSTDMNRSAGGSDGAVTARLTEEAPQPDAPEDETSVAVPPSDKPLYERFGFSPGQATFDGQVLEVPTGAALHILQQLVSNLGQAASFQELDKNVEGNEASEKIRTAIGKLRREIKDKRIPVTIENRKRVGYVMLPSKR